MKTIIAGSRESRYAWDISIATIEWAVRASNFIITEVVYGEARGADTQGKEFAIQHGLPYTSFPADWNLYGKGAGYRRNAEMGNYGEQLILLWDGVSKGSNHMLSIARAKNMPYHIHYLFT